LDVSGSVALGGVATLDATVSSTSTHATLAADLGTSVAFLATTGTTIAAGTDNGRINVSLAAAAAGDTNSVTVGNENNFISDATTAGHVSVTVGTGSNLIDLDSAGAGGAALTYSASVTLGAHTGADEILTQTVAANVTAPNTTITGAAAGDLLVFHDAATIAANASATQVAAIAALSNLAQAINYLDTGLAQHTAISFQYGGNTYIIEAGTTGAGALQAGDSLVELVGLHTLTASTALTGGVVHVAT
jgi:hypothetical protein